MRGLIPTRLPARRELWSAAHRFSANILPPFSLRGGPACRSTAPRPAVRQVSTAAQAYAAAEPATDMQGHTAALNVEARTSKTTLAHLTDFQFNQLNVSHETKRAVSEVMGYQACTSVQADAIPAMLTGADVVCKAKTGTGKTLAFLIPAIEAVLKNPPPPGSVGVLVISPARELAMQIETEAKQLTRFHNLTTQVVVGGTNMKSEMNRLIQQPPDILVATPGRLNDHLENGKLRNRTHQLRVLVFDEADRLLDMGFRRDIDKMLSLLPPKDRRQTVLFSATFPKDTNELCKFALRPSFAFVDTVGEDTIDTNKQVQQQYAVTPLKDQMAALHQVIHNHKLTEPHYKVMVFFVTANQTALASELFQKVGEPVLEMHSRKSQSHRTKTADTFRNMDRGIMFSSDVSARGVDYPDVTLVVQVGVPSEREQYIHRVGRTARAGKQGQSVLLLADFESYFMRQLTDLPVSPLQLTDLGDSQSIMDVGMRKVTGSVKDKAYTAFLGFYNSQRGVKWSKEQLVQNGNYYSTLLGCPEPPALQAKTVGMMGLKGVPGLTIQKRAPPMQQPAAGGRQQPQASTSYQQSQGQLPSPRQSQSTGPYARSPAQPATSGRSMDNGLAQTSRQAPRQQFSDSYAPASDQGFARRGDRSYDSQPSARSAPAYQQRQPRGDAFDSWDEDFGNANAQSPAPPGFGDEYGGEYRGDRGAGGPSRRGARGQQGGGRGRQGSARWSGRGSQSKRQR